MSIRETFPSIPAILAPGQVGEARVEHFEVSEHASRMTAFRPREYVPSGKYARIYVGRSLMMSDTDMERRSNYEFVRRAHGRVLVAGLGLGLILHPTLRKKEVRSVTVIEKSADVVSLVGPSVAHKKLTIITADIMEWAPPKGEKWNTIYFDIWPDICGDNLDEIATLHRRFARKLDRTDRAAWMSSWCVDELRDDRRRNRNAYF